MPRWPQVITSLLLWTGFLFFVAWVLAWAWALAVVPVFNVVQISYWQSLGVVLLFVVAGGVIFRLIPALTAFAPFAVSPPSASQSSPSAPNHQQIDGTLAPSSQHQQSFQTVDDALNELHQMLQQVNSHPAPSAGPPVPDGQKDPVETPPEPKEDLSYLVLRDGLQEWNE